MIEFVRLADGVYSARTSPLDVTTSLVIGDHTALVIDTLSTDAQAAELLAAVRVLTGRPVTVLNTHAHFDHWLGNAVVADDRPVYAHPSAMDELGAHAARRRDKAAESYRSAMPGFGDAIAASTIKIPDHAVRPPHHFDLGGRVVTIDYHGRGHTDADLVATVADAGIVFTGDLVETSGPPGFGRDSYPLSWPETVASMLRAAPAGAIFVPGHGPAVDAEAVGAQHTDLARFAWLIREAHGDGGTVDAVAARAPWPAGSVRTGVERGFAALDDPIE